MSDSENLNDEDIFEERLSRLYNKLSEKRGDSLKNNKIPKPILTKVGTKKVSIENFGLIVLSLNRDVQHLQKFLCSELSTECNLAGNLSKTEETTIIIKGKFFQKDFMKVLQNYYNQFVQCKQCTSNQTILSKEQRNEFLVCSMCNSKYCVSN